MPAVRMRLDKDLDRMNWAGAESPPQAGEVVARIHRLPDAGVGETAQGRPSKVPGSYLIPAGTGTYKTISLEPGRYLIQAFLPSGEVASETISVRESDEPVEVALRGLHSPREWLSWQHLVGNIGPAQDAIERSRNAFPESHAWSWDLSVVAATTTTPHGREPVASALDEFLTHRRETGSFLNVVVQAGLQIVPAILSHSEGPYRSYVFGPNSPAYQADAARRYILVQDGGRPVLLGALPLPWTQVGQGSRQAEVEVLLSPPPEMLAESQQPSTTTSVAASVMARDEMLATVIGYLGTGDMPAADAALTRARSMLFKKVENAIAAAAGGYILLGNWRGQPGDQDADWFSWIENLQNWFTWLPDGAIQHGWLKLRTQTGPACVEAARESFLNAHRRGIPFYSAGVRLLHDGLTLLSNDARAAGRTDKEVESALASLRAIAFRTEMRQVFTTIRL